MKPILGIVGSIGSGKSLVATEFGKRGGYLINADALGHEALRQPEIRRKVVERFGPEILDEQGEIVRKRLAAKVFAAADELRTLEAIVFPYIEARINEEIARGQRDADSKFIVLDAAVMFEASWSRRCDKLICVDAPFDVRLARLQRQRGWSDAQLRSREAAQMPLDEKKSRCHVVLDNRATPAQLGRQLDNLLRKSGLA